jgi:monoamine oxidase
MTAYLLEKTYGSECRTTLFESAARCGGKIQTRTFDSAPACYEAGVAECYDYSHLGHDPLRQLVDELGLETVPVAGYTVIMDGHALSGENAVRRHHGERTVAAIQEFRRVAAAMMPLSEWHPGRWQFDHSHPWSRRTFESILEEIEDPQARRYITVAAQADLATEPHPTNGVYGLQNVVMDVPGYVRQYSIASGMEVLPRRLLQKLTRTFVELNCRVERVSRTSTGRLSLAVRSGSQPVTRHEFDAVYLALPHNCLGAIRFEPEPLRRVMAYHYAFYDHPGHYLRVSVLFRQPFWRQFIEGAWFTLDAFGGCCVYDESLRYPCGDYGVLGWLLAGSEALLRGNLGDAELSKLVVNSLPEPLASQARRHFIEAKVHRWAAAVSGQPGGVPVRDPLVAHQPDPERCPRLFVVGDYLFDSTLNGVLDSARFATALLRERMTDPRSCWIPVPDVEAAREAVV